MITIPGEIDGTNDDSDLHRDEIGENTGDDTLLAEDEHGELHSNDEDATSNTGQGPAGEDL